MSGYNSMRPCYQREARLVTRIRQLEMRNANLRDALEGANELLRIWHHDMPDCDVMDHYNENFDFQKRWDAVIAALERVIIDDEN